MAILRLPNRCNSFCRDYTKWRESSEFVLCWPGGWHPPRHAVAGRHLLLQISHHAGPDASHQAEHQLHDCRHLNELLVQGLGANGQGAGCCRLACDAERRVGSSTAEASQTATAAAESNRIQYHPTGLERQLPRKRPQISPHRIESSDRPSTKNIYRQRPQLGRHRGGRLRGTRPAGRNGP